MTLLIGSYKPNIGLLALGEGADQDWEKAVIQALPAHPSPSWLAYDERTRLLFAVEEGLTGAKIHSYRLQEQSLEWINQQASDALPCHLLLLKEKKELWVSNYGGGTVSIFIYQDDGSFQLKKNLTHAGNLGPNKRRQESSHPHCCLLAPSGQGVFSSNLGLDGLFYHPLSSYKEFFFPLEPGTGPRHMALSQEKKIVFVLCELSSTVLSFLVSEKDELQFLDSSPTICHPVQENNCSEIVLHPRLPILYAANRGAETIFVCRFDNKGKLFPLEEVTLSGSWPRHIALDPQGRYLFVALERSDKVEVFKVDPIRGNLEEMLHWDFPQPTYIGFKTRTRR